MECRRVGPHALSQSGISVFLFQTGCFFCPAGAPSNFQLKIKKSTLPSGRKSAKGEKHRGKTSRSGMAIAFRRMTAPVLPSFSTDYTLFYSFSSESSSLPPYFPPIFVLFAPSTYVNFIFTFDSYKSDISYILGFPRFLPPRAPINSRF